MIFDTVANLERYRCIRGIDAIIGFLKANDPGSLTRDMVELEGPNLFVKVIRYQIRGEKPAIFETHNLYADLQVIVSGHEIMEYTGQENLVQTDEYNPSADVQFFHADCGISAMVVNSGMFALFMPGEAHRPGCPDGNAGDQVFKLVFKIRI